MSNITLPIAELKPALAGLGKIIGRCSSLPVLKMVKIESSKDGVTLTSTDLDSFITVSLEQPATGAPGAVLVPYEDLSRITKKCQKNETIIVSKAGDKALIQYPIGTQTGEEHLDSLPVADFPQVPEVKGEPITIHNDLRESIHEAMQCASEDETRIILNGAYLDVSDAKCHQVIATDGRHLYGSNSFTLPLKQSILIPDHKFLGWKEFNSDGEWRVQMNDELLQISTLHWRFITRQVEGNYPNWRQVVPKPEQFNTTVELSPAAITTILALIPRIPCHDGINNPIGLIVEKKKVLLRGRGVNDKKFTDLEVDGAKIKGNPVTIFLNRQFLTKALKFGMSTISIIDELSPMRLSNGGKQMIVMPVRSQGPSPAPSPAPSASTPASPDASPAKEEAEQPSPSGDTERSTNMPRTTTTNGTSAINRVAANGNGNGRHQTAETKPAIVLALEKIEFIKSAHRVAISGLNDLADTLKQVQREQKTTVKEVASVRTTLEKLQSVRI